MHVILIGCLTVSIFYISDSEYQNVFSLLSINYICNRMWDLFLLHEGQISPEGLLYFLLGPETSPVVLDKLAQCHDMNQPVPHYFIKSSHNTYLTGNTAQASDTCIKGSISYICSCILLFPMRCRTVHYSLKLLYAIMKCSILIGCPLCLCYSGSLDWNTLYNKVWRITDVCKLIL